MKHKALVWLVVGAIFSTLVVWSPFILRLPDLPGWSLDFSAGMETVFANFDGPNYLIVAKSWYDPEMIRRTFSSPLPLNYYPAHLPLFPALVAAVDWIMPGTWAMLLVTLIGVTLAVGMFYRLVGGRAWLTAIFLLLPARWLVVRSIGSPEPWFIFFILASLYQFKRGKYWWAGIWGALAQLTKSPAILLFGGYAVYFLISHRRSDPWRSDLKRMVPLLLIPLIVLPLFWFYQLQTGDFWAYFHSGDNLHLFWPPFSIFSPKGAFWTGDFWLEEIIWMWLIYGLGIIRLWRKGELALASFAGVFWASTLFVAHRDVARYILPIAPLVLIGFEDVVQKREVRWLVALLAIPILLYAWNFMLHNTAPVADWTPYQ